MTYSGWTNENLIEHFECQLTRGMPVGDIVKKHLDPLKQVILSRMKSPEKTETPEKFMQNAQQDSEARATEQQKLANALQDVHRQNHPSGQDVLVPDGGGTPTFEDWVQSDGGDVVFQPDIRPDGSRQQ